MLVVLMFVMTYLLLLQILCERRALSENILPLLLNLSLASVIKEPLAPETEFWNSEKTLTTLAERSYFS
jgi:hypothetical protein